jgi:hypothetical protein
MLRLTTSYVLSPTGYTAHGIGLNLASHLQFRPQLRRLLGFLYNDVTSFLVDVILVSVSGEHTTRGHGQSDRIILHGPLLQVFFFWFGVPKITLYFKVPIIP